MTCIECEQFRADRLGRLTCAFTKAELHVHQIHTRRTPSQVAGVCAVPVGILASCAAPAHEPAQLVFL